MGGASLPPAAMPPLPLSHSQSGHADAAAAPMTALAATTKPVAVASTEHALDATTVPMIPPHSGGAASATTGAHAKPLKKHHSKKKKKKDSVSESTPLILKAKSKSPTEEEVHPLPWFRSPEWPRKSPPLNTNDKRRKASNRYRRGRSNNEQTSMCNAIMSTVCCGLVAQDSDADLELGVRHTTTDGEQLESEGFKQCVQFLVGLIVLVAAVLIVMIIFQPFQQDSSLW